LQPLVNVCLRKRCLASGRAGMGAKQPMPVHDILRQLRPCKQTMRVRRPMFQKGSLSDHFTFESPRTAALAAQREPAHLGAADPT